MKNEISCRLTSTLIRCLQNRGYEYSRLYADMPYCTDTLLNPKNWIPSEHFNLMVDRAVQMTKNPNIMYEIGLLIPQLFNSSLFKNLIKFCGTPYIAYHNIGHYGTLFNQSFRYQVELISTQGALISLKHADPEKPSQHACKYAQGVLAQIPCLWNLPPAEITELYCACNRQSQLPLTAGDIVHDCMFRIKWQRLDSLRARFNERLFVRRSTIQKTIAVMEYNYQLQNLQNTKLTQQNNLLSGLRRIAAAVNSSRTVKHILENILTLCRDIPGVRLAVLAEIDLTENNGTTKLTFSEITDPRLQAGLKDLGIDTAKLSNNSSAGDFSFSPSQLKFIRRHHRSKKILSFSSLSRLMAGFWPSDLCESIEKQAGFRQFTLIPLSVDSRGCLELFLATEENIPADIWAMLKHHLSIAFNNARSMEKLAIQNRELSVINTLAVKATQSQDLPALVNQAVNQVGEVFDEADAVIHWRDDKTGEYIPIWQTENAGNHLVREDLSGFQTHLGRFLNSEDELFAGSLPDFHRIYDLRPDLPAPVHDSQLLVAVITIAGKRAGTITLVRTGRHFFRESEKQLLVSISRQLAMLFEKSQLHQNLLKRISELEKTRTNLSETERKLHITLDSVSEAVIVISPEGKIVEANNIAYRMCGYENTEEFLGKSALRFVVFEDRRRILEYMKAARESGLSRKSELIMVRKDGIKFEAECNISVFRKFLGLPDGFIIIIRDISVRKQTEKRLIVNERRYRLIAENTNDFIATISFGGFFAYVSPSYRQLGFEPTELINKPGLDLIHPEDRKLLLPILLKYSQMDASDLMRVKKENPSQRLEYRIKDKSGNWRNFDTTSNIIESHDGRSYLLLFISRDVTERKKAADEMKTLYAREKATSQALAQEIHKRADFFNALVHELKTPLTPILVSSETLKELAPDSTFRNLASNVFHAATRLNNRTDELLDISKGEMGLLKLKTDPVDINILLKDLLNYIQPQIAQNRQFLIASIPAILPQVNGEEMRIRQIILNLLDNAIKFTPDNGNIFLEVIADSQTLLFKIKDTGRGISEVEKERIFQPYNRIEADRQHFSGLGLGLALCKQLVELHGGKIWIESQKNQGTTFCFTLPAIPASQTAPTAKANPNTVKS
ncbi:MAG TPA: PAS domain S-box protein [Dehalococcoidales bacterium]|nr:PAS domain S-box protein [Dehalococcoidales bacterium]